MVELRKRKEAPPAPEKPAKKKAGPRGKKEVSKVEEVLEKAGEAVTAVVEKVEEALAGATNGAKAAPKVGDSITLEGFGGEVETQDGKAVTLKQLVDESKSGVILFTYPKASTPGCEFSHLISTFKQRLTKFRRHDPSLRLPRRLLHPYSHGSLNLWPVLGWSEGKHNLQDQAIPPLHPALRSQIQAHCPNWHVLRGKNQTRRVYRG